MLHSDGSYPIGSSKMAGRPKRVAGRYSTGARGCSDGVVPDREPGGRQTRSPGREPWGRAPPPLQSPARSRLFRPQPNGFAGTDGPPESKVDLSLGDLGTVQV